MDFFKTIEEHLKIKGRVIAITQGKNKLTKKDTNKLKHNFTYQDVLNVADSVEDFIKALPKHGFTDGTVLSLRKIHGNTTQLIKETSLTFNESSHEAEPLNTDKVGLNAPAPQMQTPPQQQQATPQPQLTANHHDADYISLRIKAERFDEMKERLKDVEKKADNFEQDYRNERQRADELQRKIDTIEDRHELKMNAYIAEKKGFFDTETGQQIVGGLAGNLPDLITALKGVGRAQVPAMGVPNLSAAKQQFINELQHVPDEFLPLVGKVISNMQSKEGFYETIVELTQ